MYLKRISVDSVSGGPKWTEKVEALSETQCIRYSLVFCHFWTSVFRWTTKVECYSNWKPSIIKVFFNESPINVRNAMRNALNLTIWRSICRVSQHCVQFPPEKPFSQLKISYVTEHYNHRVSLATDPIQHFEHFKWLWTPSKKSGLYFLLSSLNLLCKSANLSIPVLNLTSHSFRQREPWCCQSMLV